MQVRKAKRKDLKRIVELWWELESSHTRYDTFFYAKNSRSDCLAKAEKYFSLFMEDPKRFIIVAEEKGKVTGYLAGMLASRPPIYSKKNQGVIDTLIVDKPYRRKGIATRMMKRAEMEFRKRKADLIALNMNTKNRAAKSFYSSAGFRNLTIQVVKSL